MDPSSCSFPIAQPQILFGGALSDPSQPHLSVPVSLVHSSVCFPSSLSLYASSWPLLCDPPPPLSFSTCSAVYLTAMQPAAMNSCWLGRSAAFSYWLFLSSEASFSYRSFTVCWFVRGLWAGHKKNITQWVREGETHNKLTACMEAEKKNKTKQKKLDIYLIYIQLWHSHHIIYLPSYSHF